MATRVVTWLRGYMVMWYAITQLRIVTRICDYLLSRNMLLSLIAENALVRCILHWQ